MTMTWKEYKARYQEHCNRIGASALENLTDNLSAALGMSDRDRRMAATLSGMQGRDTRLMSCLFDYCELPHKRPEPHSHINATIPDNPTEPEEDAVTITTKIHIGSCETCPDRAECPKGDKRICPVVMTPSSLRTVDMAELRTI